MNISESMKAGGEKILGVTMPGKVKKLVLSGHRDSVTSVTVDQSYNCLLSASCDRTLRLWDVRLRNSSIRLMRVPETDGEVNVCRATGDIVTVSSGNSLFGYDIRASESIIVNTPSFRYTSASEECEINDFGFSSDNAFIAAPNDDGDVEIIDSRTFKRIQTVRGPHSNIASVARFMPNDNNLVTTGYDCFIANTKVSESYKLDKRIGLGSLLPPIEEDDDAPPNPCQTVNPPFGTSMQISSDSMNPEIAVGCGDGSVLIIPSRKGKPDFRSITWGGANVHSTASCGLAWDLANSSVWSVGNDSVLINIHPDRIRVRYALESKPNSVMVLDTNKVAVAGVAKDIEILEFF
jgi:WD40 repeat protein